MPATAAENALVPLPLTMPVSVVAPVPPLPTFSVPAMVMVPAPVTGPPEVVRPVVPPDTSTEVTVPEPPPVAVSVPPESERPEPTVICSMAPVLAVVRPKSRAVVIVKPELVTAPEVATVTAESAFVTVMPAPPAMVASFHRPAVAS